MNRRLALPTLALSILLAAGCGGERTDDLTTAKEPEAGSAAPKETGTISGRVTLAGAAPELEPFQITANGDVCGSAAKSNLLTLGEDGGIVGAVVYLEGRDAPAGAIEPATMDQVSCQYTPHIVATTPGSIVRFTNSDPAPHNVRVESIESGRILLNVAQPTQGRVDEWKVPEAGSYLVACDYHPWMNAYIVAVPSRAFAVTGADGSYRIEGAPVGGQTVTVLHNSLTMREKRDQGGRLVGYRFDAPIARKTPVSVVKDQNTVLDIPLDLSGATAAK